jgi:hypothetical protein
MDNVEKEILNLNVDNIGQFIEDELLELDRSVSGQAATKKGKKDRAADKLKQDLKLNNKEKKPNISDDEFNALTKRLDKDASELIQRTQEAEQAVEEVETQGKNIVKEANFNPVGISEGIEIATQGLMNFSMILTSVMGLIDVWNDKDLSWGDKLMATIPVLASIIPMTMSTVTSMITLHGSIKATAKAYKEAGNEAATGGVKAFVAG